MMVMHYRRGRRTMVNNMSGLVVMNNHGRRAMVNNMGGLVMMDNRCRFVMNNRCGLVMNHRRRLMVIVLYNLTFIVVLGSVVIHLNLICTFSIVSVTSVVSCKNLCRHKHSAYNHCDNHQLFHNIRFLKLLLRESVSFLSAAKL
jgi:hypothetical protein